MIDINDFIKNHTLYFDPDITNHDDCLNLLMSNKYDMVAYKDKIIIRDTFPIFYRDIVTDIKIESKEENKEKNKEENKEINKLMYSINNIEYDLLADTKFIPALTPFKSIYLIAKGKKKYTTVTFTRILMKPCLVNFLRKAQVKDNQFIYLDGYVKIK